jgi:type 1 glutamine amidotransferase
MIHITRRHLLKSSAFAAAAVALGGCASLTNGSSDKSPKKILFFTKSSGFQHSVITRSAEDPTKLAYAEKMLTDWAAPHGFDVTCSKDGNIFTPENLKRFDAFAFYTTGDLTQPSDKYEMKKDKNGKATTQPTDKLLWREPGMPAGAKEAFLDAIKAGKGFIGFHAAADTFHSTGYVRHGGNMLRDIDEKGEDDFDPYIKMLGGEFIIHGKQQAATLKCIDKKFPGAPALDQAKFQEEWYSLKNFSPDLHVVLAMDTTGMEGKMYERPMFPQSWARMHGKGRVFYTSLGHREDVWLRPDFQQLVIGALNWTTRRFDADITPNLKKATPQAEVKTAPTQPA